jgi:hypothetical protein
MRYTSIRIAAALGAYLLAARSLPAQGATRGDLSPGAPARGAPSTGDRIAGWRADVDSLVAQVRARHWRFREAPLPAEFTERARRLRAAVDTLGDDRIVVEMQALLATLHDGHTLVFPFGMRRGGLSRLPLGLYEFQDGLAIVAADSAHLDLRGRRVRSIGGVPAAELASRIAPLLSLENVSELRWAYPTYLTFPAFLRAAGVPADSSGVRIELDSDAGRTTVVLKPVPPPLDPGELILGLVPPPAAPGAPRAAYLSRLSDAYWSSTLDGGRTVYVQMNRVASDPRDPLDRFAQRLLDTLVRPATRALVVDLRNNSGGNAALLPPIVRSVVAFRALRPAAPIYLLIGRQTFSAAQTLVNRIEEYCAPIIVGEESGSRPNRFGNGVGFRLPYSGIRGEISSGYNQAATSRDARSATEPAVRIGLTLRDWLAGRDPVMDSVSVLLR